MHNHIRVLANGILDGNSYGINIMRHTTMGGVAHDGVIFYVILVRRRLGRAPYQFEVLAI